MYVAATHQESYTVFLHRGLMQPQHISEESCFY